MRLLVNGNSLDLGENAQISLKLQNPAYLGSGVGVIKGDFSFPFELPMTGVNRINLGFPDRMDNAERPRTDLPAELYVGPSLILSGVMNVLSASRTTAKVALINNPLSDLTKQTLDELDLGTLSVASEAELRALMKDTADNPTDHDFIFFPIHNGALREEVNFTPPPTVEQFQNAYNSGAQEFRTDQNITPFLRTAVVLRKALEASGYTLADSLHANEDLARMVLVNNRTMRSENRLTLDLPLNLCVSNMKVSDLVKELARIFCLAPFSALGSNQITLQSLTGLVGAEPKADWSQYAGREYTRDNFNGGVSRYEFPEGAYSDVYHYSFWEYDTKATTGLERDILDDNGDPIVVPDGEVYYLQGRSALSQRKSLSEGVVLLPLGSFGFIENEFGNEVVSPNLYPAQTNPVFFYPTNFDRISLPTVSWSMAGVVEEDGTTFATTESVQMQLSIYRGYQNTKLGESYPMGSHNNYDSNFQRIPNSLVSLNWEGTDGLYNKYWREWDGMLQRSGAVSRQFLLPIAELISFDFSHKVRVDNQNYFVRSLEFNVTNRGVSPAKADLLSVS